MQARKKELNIELIVANEIPLEICTDWQIYSEVLFHLMQNAFKFSHKGGKVKITVSYHPLKLRPTKFSRAVKHPFKTFGFIVTEVEDSGNGINKDNLGSLFKMFNEGSHTSNRTSGIGLGLSTARSLSLAL